MLGSKVQECKSSRVKNIEPDSKRPHICRKILSEAKTPTFPTRICRLAPALLPGNSCTFELLHSLTKKKAAEAALVCPKNGLFFPAEVASAEELGIEVVLVHLRDADD